MKLSRPMQGSPALVASAFVVVTMAGFGAIILVSLHASEAQPALVAVPLGVAGCAIAGLILLLACAGNGAAILVYFVVLAFVNDALFRERNPGELGLDWQNAMKMVLWGGAVLIGICHLKPACRIAGSFPFIVGFVYAGYALLSSIYSEAPAYTFGTAFGVLAMVIFPLALVVRLSERQILLSFALTLWVFLIVGWVVYYAVPGLGRSPFITADNVLVERMCGIAGQANPLGRVIAILLGLCFLLWYRGHCRIVTVLPIAASGFITLLAADSRTSLLAIIVGSTAVIASRSFWRQAGLLLMTLFGALVVVSVPLRTMARFTLGLSRSGDPTELVTLTGRTEIWDFAWDKIVLNPWVGYGYNSAKYILPQFMGLGIQVDEAHNMWLQNLLSVGIIGTLPLGVLVVTLLVCYAKRPSPARDLFTLVMLIYGISSAGAFGSTPTILTLTIFMGIAMSRTDVMESALWHAARPESRLTLSSARLVRT